MSLIGHNHPPEDVDDRTHGGYIKVYRDIRTHPIVGHCLNVKPADSARGSANRGEAWQDLIMEASYRPQRRRNQGREVWLDVGDLMAAHGYLAERWNWTVKQVRRFLDLLESEGMIYRPKPEERASEGQAKGKRLSKQNDMQDGMQKGKQSTVNGKTRAHNTIQIISICNYSEFQRYDYAINEANKALAEAFEETKGQAFGQEDGQAKGQAAGETVSENGQESNKEINKYPRGRAGARETDPFGLNPYNQTASIQRLDDGTITLANGKRAEWLKLFDNDETDLNLALLEVKGLVQANAGVPLQAQVEKHLARMARQRREKTKNYEKTVEKSRAAPRSKPPPSLSIDERLRLEREAKARGAGQ